MRVSIVVTTLDNDEGKLDLALQGWLRVLNAHPDAELLLVNDGGPKGISGPNHDMMKYGVLGFPGVPHQVRFMYLEPMSDDFRLAQARNMGIRSARGDRVVFTDSDCIPTVDLPVQHDLGEHTNKIAIGFRSRIARPVYESWHGILPDNNTLCHAKYRNDERFDEIRPPGWRGCEHVWGCNFSVDRNLLVECGGFDESIVGWGGEDINLADRLMRHKKTQLVVTASVVFHLDHPPRTIQSKHPFGARGQPLVANGGTLF